ncbi:MAG: hypothetical protein VX641_04725 [Planctomycetota bacterium]|nr:hypothetical protein [Planctomycetota bacterium]
MATMLILFGLFDSGLSLVMGGLATELDALRREVADSATDMHIGKFFNVVSGGLVNVGKFAEGTAIKQIVEELPALWWMAILAWSRLLISLIGFGLGWYLTLNKPSCVRLLMIWAVISAGFFFVELFSSFDLVRLVYAEGGLWSFCVLAVLNVGLHLVWPTYVFWKIRRDGAHELGS